MPADDPLHGGEPDPVPIEFGVGVEPLKHAEQLSGIGHVETGAVVAHEIGTGLVALALNVSAYNGETFRAGIQSIRKGQSEAALALGMSCAQVMREVVLPQAARRVAPVLASTWVSLFKDTSLVSVIAVGELAYTAMRIRSQSFRVLEMLTAMAAIYWALGYPQAKLTDWLYRRFGVRE